jgi:tetratricopeptide (TPR) repeat protein
MSHYRLQGLFLKWCAIVAGLVACTLPALLQAAPFTPANDGQVLEVLPGRAGDATVRALSVLRAAAANAPGDPEPATALAQAYFDQALARGDPRYVGYAEAIVSRFGNPVAPPLLTLRGVLRQYRHDFAGGLQDFAAALALDPTYATAHAWRGAIFLVQADYAAAQTECNALQRLGRDALAGACLGLAQAYGGQLKAGYGTLQSTLGRVSSPGSRLWVLTRLGEVAAWLGQPTQAQAHYREALKIGRDDVYLLAAWSDFLLDAGQPAEVVRLLSSWESADSLLLRLAEAETTLQLPAAARHRQMLTDRFAAARARGDSTHRSEEARFELRLRNDSATALRLAQENYAVQREPRDARVLLEAAVAAKDPVGGKAALDWLQRSGFEDVRTRELAKTLEMLRPKGGTP